jgi:PAS domain S-box-containing protein
MYKDDSHQADRARMGLRGKTILGLGALLLSVLLLMGLATYYQGKSLAIKKVLENIQENVAKDSTVIEHQIADARSNLMAIATTPPVQGIIRAKDNGGRDPLTGETTDIWLARFEKIFTAFISFHPGYAYIRYIDEKGNEIIRVDLEGGRVRTAPRSELETRSGYSYFKERLKLKQGEIYYSDVSLAKKNEQFVFPYKPQFRLSTPLYDDKQRVRGMIILNLYASSLFASLTPEMNGTKKYLINQNGYFLVHPDKSKEFGFDLGSDYTIRNSHPLLAKELKIKDVFAEHHKQHIGGFHKIFFDPANKDRYWAVIYEIPESVVLKDIYTTQNTMLLVGIFITAFSIAVITWYISKKIVSPIVTLAEAAKKLEGGDLSVRVQERLAEDEFQTLYHTINSFADSQQQYTEKIKQSEERFRSLVQNSSDIITLLKKDGTISYVSPSIERFLGYAPVELIGKNACEFVYPPDMQGVSDTFNNVIQKADLISSVELRVMGKNSLLRIFESIFCNQLSNPAIGHIVINARDITERKESENRIKLINMLLRLFAQTDSRKEYLDTILDSIRHYSHCSCAGLRVIDSYGNIPYESSTGFSEKFLESECWLSIKRDRCICTRVIAGRLEPQDNFCTTPSGSFYCSDMNGFFAKLSVEELARYSDVCLKEGFQSISVVPILYRETILGAIHLADKEAGKLSLERVQAIESLTPIIGEAIHRFNLEEELYSNYFSQAAINMVLSLSLEDIPLEEFFVKTLNMILAIPWLSFGSSGKIFLVGDDPDVLIMIAKNNVPESTEPLCAQVPFGKCLCGRAAATQEIQFADHIDERHEVCHEEMSPHGHYAVPILFGDRTLGVLNMNINKKHVRHQKEDEFLLTIADTLAGIIMRRQAESALRKSEASLANAQRIAHLGNWDWDITKNTLSWSDEIYHMFGIARQEFGATFEAFLNCVHPEDREFVKKSVYEALPENKPYHIEYRIILPDRSVRFIYEQAEVTASQDGKPIRMVGTVQDITERKIAEEYKEKLQYQLLQSQKMEAVGQLTGGIAHDFNNILTAIITYGHFLQMKLKDDDPLKRYVDNILSASERAASLTQGLLAFSRKQITNPRPTNLNEIIREMGSLFFRVICDTIELKSILTDEDLIIMADTKQIDQVLLNLLTNARDAMPDGGMVLLETKRVEIDETFVKSHGYGEPGEYALLSVTDTGTGMDRETKERIFEPFFTTKEVGKGTGLGLAMVYGIIKQHSGHINVYSEPGKGTIFNIYLPLIKATATGTKPETVCDSEGGTETILLAEDNTEVRESTMALLEEFGYTVIEAVNGEDAINIYRDNKDAIDLVLLDMIMPKKNGKEVYDKIKEMRPDLKVLFMSGYTANVPDKIMTHEEGLDIISKPFTKNDFLKRVREALSK